MRVTEQQREAKKQANLEAKARTGVQLVGIGFKRSGGVRTKDVAIVFGVEKKKPMAELAPSEVLPRMIGSVPTDVIETGVIKARAFVQKMRPCPPAFSIGHTTITAGTLGAYVKRTGSDDWFVLSNNHVLAASNAGSPGDIIIQPGKADGGFSGTDSFARLTEFATVNMIGGGKDKEGKKASKLTTAWWAAWAAIPNLAAKLVGCPRRLAVLDIRRHPIGPRAVSQPNPNLIDAAVALPMTQGYVKLAIPQIGEPRGIRDFELGDAVQKSGRTTEHTTGMVEVVEIDTQVQYDTGIAMFTDQILIANDTEPFSQPGDSGSAILDMDGYIGALLFAGGTEGDRDITIACKISNVSAILGIHI